MKYGAREVGTLQAAICMENHRTIFEIINDTDFEVNPASRSEQLVSQINGFASKYTVYTVNL